MEEFNIMLKLSFSQRLRKALGCNSNLSIIFQEEFVKVANELAKDWNISDIGDKVASWVEIQNKKLGLNSSLSALEKNIDGTYNVVFNSYIVDIARNNLKYNNKLIYDSNEKLVRNAGAHEACHLIAELIEHDSVNNKKHEGMFRNLYLKYRSRYTDAPFITEGDGRFTNFSIKENTREKLYEMEFITNL